MEAKRVNRATNLIILGDSNAKGITNKNSRLSLCQVNAASLIANHFQFPLTNLSYYGQTIAKVCQRGFLSKILAHKMPHKRNLVVINLGSNDADYNWIDVGITGGTQHGPRTSPEDFEKFYTELVLNLKKHGFEVLICSLLPLVSARYFDSTLCNLSPKENILKLLDGDKNNLIIHQDIFNNLVLKIAQELNIPLLDLRNIILSTPNWQDLYSVDGIHLTEEGQELIANKIISSYSLE